MDSITQITLGAAVGEAVLGKKAGNKAVLWGAVAGTIPDLDMISAVFLEPVHRLVFHRGFSHSILFALLFAPLLGYMISKIYRDHRVGWKDWSQLSFWGLFTHALLDSFTTYGTQLFYPFSDYRVAFDTIFVIDPFYTVPFLICVITVLFLKRTSFKRRIVNYLGIGISTAYLCFTVVNKFHVNSVVENALSEQGLQYRSYMTSPTPLNNLLWRYEVVSEGRVLQGQYSLLDSGRNLTFNAITRNTHLIEPIREHWEIDQLLKVSRGYYTVTEAEDAIVFNDLRFGRTAIDAEGSSKYVTAFKIRPYRGFAGESLEIERLTPAISIDAESLHTLIQRIKGQQAQ